MNHATNFLRKMGLDPNQPSKKSVPRRVLRTATIPNNYVVGSGWPTVLFDGENAIGSKTYPYHPSYTPKPNDRVVLLMFTNSGYIVGPIAPSTNAQPQVPVLSSAPTNVSAGFQYYNSSTNKMNYWNGSAWVSW